MSFLKHIDENFNRFKDRNAFYIGESFFTYAELDRATRSIASIILKNIKGKQNTIGVITYDSLQTYASILAIWLTRNIFVPLNPRNPAARNAEIIKQAGISSILTSEMIPEISLENDNTKIFSTKKPAKDLLASLPDEGKDDDILYILITSCSTGVPKGVPINLKNLGSFVNAFISHGYEFTPEDCFLQIYDLSFDASIHCYTVPLVTGSSIFTVPQDEIKYLFALKLMKNHDLTFIKMPPSTLSYLRPYFNNIRLEKLRYCLFGGEALDKNHNKVETGEIGELYVAGFQITPGYWNNPVKNRESFIELEVNHKNERFYKTGDLSIVDKDGDFLFCGRIDEQGQIDGFRVELGEIEHHARESLKISNVAAVAVRGRKQTLEIHLFTENTEVKIDELRRHLESRLPAYMQPVKIHNIKEFPKSSGGKVNKQELRRRLGA